MGQEGEGCLSRAAPRRNPDNLDFPSGHQRHIKSTNVLDRLYREVKRRTREVGVFPSEKSLANLATAVMLGASEDWAFRRYLDMAPLWAGEEPIRIET